MKKKIIVGLLVVIVGMQFIPIDKENPQSNPEDDFITQLAPPENIANVLKSACYDCHSNEVKYPWYTNIAPVKFWIKHHIDEGKEHLNFSEWGTYQLGKAQHKLEECIEMVEEGEMPMESYTWMHAEAKLSDEQKESLMQWFEEKYKPLREEYLLSKLTGEFVDDYEITYNITKGTWKQDTLNTYNILKWNFEEMYIIAQNDSSNQGQQGLYTRIDIIELRREQAPYEWAYCLSKYDATTAEEAEKASCDKDNPKKGCNGFPFSRMQPSETN